MILRIATPLLMTLAAAGIAWCGPFSSPQGTPNTLDPIGFFASAGDEPAFGKDAKSPKLNREEFDKLKLGMTDKEVKDLMGKPSVEGVANGDGALIYATADFSKNITVTLKGGKVVQRIGLNLLDKDPATLTKANVEKIKNGLTLKVVVEIMGKASSESDPDPATGEGSMSWGTLNKKSLQVTFKNGKVSDFVHFGFDN